MTNTTKPIFTWEAFENGKIAVKCEKKPLAKLFLKMCDERGYKWNNGGKATKAECIRNATFPIRFVHNFNDVNDLSFSDWPLANFPEVDLTDILTIRESETVPDLKYRPFRELKPELIGRVVRQKKYHSNIAMITQVDNGWLRLGDSGSQYKASGAFDLLEFLDPKTGVTSPCGEVDCE